MSEYVEPPRDSVFNPGPQSVSTRSRERLRQDLAQADGITPTKADAWIDEHSEEAAEARIQAHWQGARFYGSGDDE